MSTFAHEEREGRAGHETGYASGTGPATATGHGRREDRLVGPDERDKLTLRLQQALNEFVDAPHDAVEEADRVLEETIARLTDSLAQRRRTLRTSWDSAGSAAATAPGATGVGGEGRGRSGDPAATAVDPLSADPTKPGGVAGPAQTANEPGGYDPRAAGGGAQHSAADTEKLRLALREYRETTERLLSL
ncbi:hypothetical protein [Streptomyces tsukubensis]|uniref:Uncharacterized protein n=1 Tax=Streptomyces tsukubensis TaxID=83656 RepID=A0A1V4A6P4_9ACTN|nr:hypothetical protein [Streptomyces tsukubensis]OON76694.1 hypothetical protein B1H18_20470 [Streptomyces tsukubensis]QFR93337.1 hypothetical protein GBW32_09880 [Streptomyces tsukubensis]